MQIKGITIDSPEQIGATPPLSPLLRVLPAPPTSPSPAMSLLQPAPPPSIAIISAFVFWRSTCKRSAYICTFKIAIAEIDRAIVLLDRGVVDKGVQEEVQIKALVPEEYHEFLPLFTEAVHNVLPPHHIYDHSILLKEGS